MTDWQRRFAKEAMRCIGIVDEIGGVRVRYPESKVYVAARRVWKETMEGIREGRKPKDTLTARQAALCHSQASRLRRERKPQSQRRRSAKSAPFCLEGSSGESGSNKLKWMRDLSGFSEEKDVNVDLSVNKEVNGKT